MCFLLPWALHCIAHAERTRHFSPSKLAISLFFFFLFWLGTECFHFMQIVRAFIFELFLSMLCFFCDSCQMKERRCDETKKKKIDVVRFYLSKHVLSIEFFNDAGNMWTLYMDSSILMVFFFLLASSKNVKL